MSDGDKMTNSHLEFLGTEQKRETKYYMKEKAVVAGKPGEK